MCYAQTSQKAVFSDYSHKRELQNLKTQTEKEGQRTRDTVAFN